MGDGWRIHFAAAACLIGAHLAVAEDHGALPAKLFPFSAEFSTESLSQLLFSSVPMQTRRDALRYVDRSVDLPARRPLRVVQFANGDRLTAEVLETSRHAAVLRLFGCVRWRIPTAAIASIAVRPGERQLLAFDEMDDSAGFAGASPNRRWLIPQSSGELTCRIGIEFPADNQRTPVGLVAKFESGDRIAITVDSAGRWHAVQSPPGEMSALQAAFAKNRERCELRLQITGERIYVSVDGRILLSDVLPPGRLQAIEFAADGNAKPTAGDITYFTAIEKRRETADFPPARDDLDAIVSVDGDAWWGDFRTLSSGSVGWTAGGNQWSRNWTDVAGIIFRETPDAVPTRKLVGRIVKLELQPGADRLDLPGDRLTGLLCGVRDGWLHVEHPLAGHLAIPLEAVRRVETAHIGESRVLALGTRRSPRAGQDSSVPAAGRFVLETFPKCDAAIVVEVSGLEPSGPQTPPGSPRLKALQNGSGVVEARVNGERLGTINQLTSRWTLPGEFDALRLEIPAQLLRVGENSWSFQETARNSRGKADEFRLRTVTLELPALLP